MSVAAMRKTHPQPVSAEAGRAIEALTECAEVCTVCADACLAERDFRELRACIELNEICADICETTASAVTRAGAPPEVMKPLLIACIAACDACAAECQRHSSHHEHCRLCAESCRACSRVCTELLGTLTAGPAT
jgi:hypothetical protein